MLTTGAVVFIPKDPDNDFPKPEELIPITILSCAYRIWAAARHSQMSKKWFPSWKHHNSCGGAGAPSADQLAYRTCVQLEAAQCDGLHAAGISFDLQECFDTIPYNLALDVFLTRGADPQVVQTLREKLLKMGECFVKSAANPQNS